MSEIDNSGTAFPFDNVEGRWGNGYPEPGMSLRDYFAAKAMQACLAVRSDNTRFWKQANLDGYAADFYEMADAMIRARTNPRGETK